MEQREQSQACLNYAESWQKSTKLRVERNLRRLFIETNVNNMNNFIHKYIFFLRWQKLIIQICGLIIHIIQIRFQENIRF